MVSGQASDCWPEEGQVPPGRGGSSHSARRLQLMEEQQVLKRVVLRELRTDTHTETRAGRAQTDAWDHGQVGYWYYII